MLGDNLKKTILLAVTLLLALTFLAMEATVQGNNGTAINCIPLVEDPVDIGEIFLVNITVTSVSDCSAWEIKLGFDQTKLNCTDIFCPPDNIFAGKANVVPKEIDNTAGFVHWGFVFFPVDFSFSGSGILCQVEFNATAMGDVDLPLLDYPITTYLVSFDNEKISSTVVDGSVTVIPEFPPSLILVVLMSLTLVAALIATKLQKPKLNQTKITN